MTRTFGQARESYTHQANLRSAHTLNAYLRAIDLFLLYLDDRKFEKSLPVRKFLRTGAAELDLSHLLAADEPILAHFITWMQTPGSERRPYASATVELRLAGVQRWFEFMDEKDWLPAEFSLPNAIELMKHQLRPEVQKVKAGKAVEEIHDLSELVNYYSTLKPSAAIRRSPERLRRWELSRLRNHALIQTLAETGGQISAILSLQAADIDRNQRPLTITVKGKSSHTYQITLNASLPAIRAYLAAREEALHEKSPLFVSHDAHFDGKRMSRVIAWRIIQRAARGVGLPEISPHDLRHWRAQQLIQDGHSLEEVRERLGHRSIHTIRTYYGHLVESED